MTKLESTYTYRPVVDAAPVHIIPVGPRAQLKLIGGRLQPSGSAQLEFISAKYRVTRTVELSSDAAARLFYDGLGSLQSQARSMQNDPRCETLLRILTSIAADLSGYGVAAADWDAALAAVRFEGLMDFISPGRAYGKAKAQLADAVDVAEALDWLCDTDLGVELIKACGERDAAGAPVQVWLDKDLQQLVFRDANERLVSAGQVVKEILREHYGLSTPGTKL